MPATPDSPRFDPVAPIHKAARHLMFEVLNRVGALDASDIFEVERCGLQVVQLIGLLPADPAERLAPFWDDLLAQRDADERAAAAAALYRALSQVVADELQAQLRTESERTPLLQAQHTDLELRLMRRRQLATMSEAELAAALRPMAEALTPQELAGFVDDLQVSVDAQAFSCLLDTLRRQATPGRWLRLARELGLPETGMAGDARSAPQGTAGEAVRPEAGGRRLHRADRHRHRSQ